MPHLVFDLNLSSADDAKRRFAASVARRFGEIMDTGADHVAVLIRSHGAADLHLGLASEPARGIALVSADIRLGRTRTRSAGSASPSSRSWGPPSASRRTRCTSC